MPNLCDLDANDCCGVQMSQIGWKADRLMAQKNYMEKNLFFFY